MARDVFPVAIPRLLARAGALGERRARASSFPATPGRHHPRHLPEVPSFAVAGRSPHAVAGDDHPLLTNLPHALVENLEFPLRYIHPVAELGALPSPRLLCTHLPHQLLPSGVPALGCRVVYLCREPKDVLVSTWHYMNKVYHDSFTEFGYWKQSMAEPSRVLFLKYDEMMADPANHVRMLAEFIGAPFTGGEESSGVVQGDSEAVQLREFEETAGELVGGDRSDRTANAKVGDWKNYMTEVMAKKLDRVVEEKLGGCGLTF
ncbi:hypothetical protein GQ55_6G253000 [Panicum hallii var. hallii]|uniref:Sulfotransferase n=1 Tax=Panicum hallii var. hallii TaxID=1504633 RepID=A0A2T7D9F1_9POAL|nr:hypothetical protein GQ55_6G253000 [Panicum hallii var. hallii]